MRFLVLLPASILLLNLSGCQQSAAPAGKLIEETWDAYSMQGVRVGYAHTRATEVKLLGEPLVLTVSKIHLSLQRSGNTVTQDVTLASWDTADGQLAHFETRMNAGGGDVVSVGAIRGKELGIDTTTVGRTESQKIPWQSDWGGLFAPEQSLRKKPLKPG